jgi:hypothetical protein
MMVFLMVFKQHAFSKANEHGASKPMFDSGPGTMALTPWFKRSVRELTSNKKSPSKH